MNIKVMRLRYHTTEDTDNTEIKRKSLTEFTKNTENTEENKNENMGLRKSQINAEHLNNIAFACEASIGKLKNKNFAESDI